MYLKINYNCQVRQFKRRSFCTVATLILFLTQIPVEDAGKVIQVWIDILCRILRKTHVIDPERGTIGQKGLDLSSFVTRKSLPSTFLPQIVEGFVGPLHLTQRWGEVYLVYQNTVSP